MSILRRDCLKLLATGLAASLAPPLLAAGERRVERIGLQLYTVRDLLNQDVAATLAAVADAGYLEVETAGTANLSATQFVAALRDAGLTAPAAHVPLALMAAQPDEVLTTATTLGNRYLVAPWLPPDQRTSAGYAAAIDTLNRFGERCADAGMTLCYHNHDFEFVRLGTVVPYELMLSECDPNLVRFELDLYWAAHAGADAAAMLAADPGRFPLCHVKDRRADGAMVDVGQGNIDFSALFAAGTGLRHYFVEHDRPEDALASINTSIRALQAIRF